MELIYGCHIERQYFAAQESCRGAECRNGSDEHLATFRIHRITDIESNRNQCDDVLCESELPADADRGNERVQDDFYVCDQIYRPEQFSADQQCAGQICKHTENIKDQQGKNSEIAENRGKKKMNQRHGVNYDTEFLLVGNTGVTCQYFFCL